MADALLQVIHRAVAAGDDPTEAILVYGDWLQSRGDVHGELIALSCGAAATADEPSQNRLHAQWKRRLSEWEVALFGVRPAHLGVSYSIERGFVDALRINGKGQVAADTLADLVARDICSLVREVDFFYTSWTHGDRPITPRLGLDDCLRALAPCARLHTLRVRGCDLGHAEPALLTQLSALRSLALQHCYKPDDERAAAWLDAVPAIEQLDLLYSASGPPVYRRLAVLDRLTRLGIDVPDNAISQIRDCLLAVPRLDRLALRFEGDWAALNLPRVRDALGRHRTVDLHLDPIEDLQLTQREYRWAAETPGLRCLHLTQMRPTQAELTALAAAQQLKELWLEQIASDSATLLGALPALPGLGTLRVEHSGDSAPCRVDYLERLPELRQFHLRCQLLAAGALDPIAQCSQLAQLELLVGQARGRHIDLGPLRGHPALARLSVRFVGQLPSVAVMSRVARLPRGQLVGADALA
ncbi:MAG: hypothetical protein AAGC55_13485, partial [Myxococcota bacterium]